MEGVVVLIAGVVPVAVNEAVVRAGAGPVPCDQVWLSTNSVPACAVFCLGRAAPARQDLSERTRKCPKALGISLKLADTSAANPHWGMS